MLDEAQRTDRYLAQTGRREPTGRQRRRTAKKTGHQSEQAFDRRATKAGQRIARREERKRNQLSASLAASA